MDKPAARDTTFDKVIPDKVWLLQNNIDRKGYLTIKIEINGIEKVMDQHLIIGLDPDEGVHCQSRNLTWILEPLKNELAEAREKINKLEALINAMRRLNMGLSK